MKKIRISLILAVIAIALGLSACKVKNKNNTDTGNTKTDVTTITPTTTTDTVHSVKYICEHYLEDLDGNHESYTLHETIEKNLMSNIDFSILEEEYSGFEFAKINVGSESKGTCIVKVYYNRIQTLIKLSVNDSNMGYIVNDKPEASYPYEYELEIEAKANPGYKFEGWYLNENLVNNDAKTTVTVGLKEANYVAKFINATDTKYTVIHYVKNFSNDKYTLIKEETLYGTTWELTNAKALDNEGLIPSNFSQKKISDSGTTIVEIYYDRKSYDFSVSNSNLEYGYIKNIALEYEYITEEEIKELDDIELESSYEYDMVIALYASPYDGHKFLGWYDGNTDELIDDSNFIFYHIEKEINIVAKFEIRTDIPYKVEHYKQNTDNDNYTYITTDNLTGTFNDLTKAQAKEYEGFTVKDFEQEAISANGETIIKIYYDRITSDLTLNYNDTMLEITGIESGTYKYDYKFNINVSVIPGYEFLGWYINDELIDENLLLEYIYNMPANDVTLVAKSEISTKIPYTVKHYKLDMDTHEYEFIEEETLRGKAFDKTKASPKNYLGYKVSLIEEKEIAGDGSTVVNIYYAPEYYLLVLDKNMNYGGDITGDGTYLYGDVANVTSTLNEDYEFLGWYINDNLVSEELEFTYTITSSQKIEARYKYVGNDLLITKQTKNEIILIGVKDPTITELVIPNSITTISEGALKGCSNLERLVIPFVGEKRYTNKSYDQYPLGFIFGKEIYDNSYSSLQYYVWNPTAESNMRETYYMPNSLKYVEVTNTDYIQEYSFCQCKSIIEIKLPEGIKEIPKRTFYQAYKLLRINIPSTVTSINVNAFEQSGYLVDLYNYSNLDMSSKLSTYIGSLSFISHNSYDESNLIYDGDYIYTVYNNTLLLVAYLENDRIVELPTSINVGDETYTSYKIVGNAFRFNTNIHSITVPSNVSNIEDYAFNSCTNLKEIYNYSALNIRKTNTSYGYIAYNATSIYTQSDDNKDYYFLDNGLKFKNNGDTLTLIGYYGDEIDLTLPETVKIGNTTYTYDIGANAFKDNLNLYKVTIPNGLNVSEGLFRNCASLQIVNLPNDLIKISSYAFYGCSSLKNLVLPNTVTEISTYAFANSGINTLEIPASVRLIDEHAFEESMIENIKFNEGLETIGKYAFTKSSIKNVVLPNSINEVGAYAFRTCKELISFDFGGLKTISFSLFENCESLKTVIGLENVESIAGLAFVNCYSLDNITVNVSEIAYYTFQSCSSLKNINFLKNVTSIGEYAFAGTAIEYFDCSKVTSIGTYAFSCCKNLKSCTFASNSSITAIPNYCFSECSSLEEFIIPNSITSIGDNAFYLNNHLRRVEIGSSVTSIASNAFSSCRVLFEVYNKSSIEVPASAMVIHTNDYGYSLVSITEDGLVFGYYNNTLYLIDYVGDNYDVVLPSSHTTNNNQTISTYKIYKNAFYESKIRSIDISSSVTAIEENAFYNSNLHSVILRSEATISNTAFKYCYHIYEIYNLTNLDIACGSDKYGEIAYYTYVIYTSLEEESKIIEYGDYRFIEIDGEYILVACFKDDNNIVLPGVIVLDDLIIYEYSIGQNVFAYNTNLTSIIISNAVTKIGKFAFNLCVNIKTLEIGENVKEIGWGAFSNCRSIESMLVIPEGITIIDQYAFSNLQLVTTVYLPSTLTQVKNYGFSSDSFTTVYYNGTKEEFNNVNFVGASTDAFTNATIYYYSEEKPQDMTESYWHFDTNGNIVEW